MMAENQMIEAFVHTQLAIEVILWNKIVEIFQEQKAREVLTTIENSNKGKDKTNTSTYELIKWSHFLGALNDKDFGHLIDFNSKGMNSFMATANGGPLSNTKKPCNKGYDF